MAVGFDPSGWSGLEEEPPLSRERLFGRRVLRVLQALTILVLFVFAIFYDQIARDVLVGERGVLWSRLDGGTVLDRTYPEGMHLTWPWDRFFIYNMREQEVRQETEVYAKDGLRIQVRSSIRFRPTPAYLPLLHQDVGPNYIEKVIKPEVVSTIRKVLGNYSPEKIYSRDEQGLLEELQSTLRNDLNTDYFEVTEFLIIELKLPVEIEAAIKDKLKEEQTMLSYEFRLQSEASEKERRTIEAKGLRDFEAISGLSILRWRGIEATEHLADAPSSKIILMGTGEGQLPVILNADSSTPNQYIGTPEAAEAAKAAEAARDGAASPAAEGGS